MSKLILNNRHFPTMSRDNFLTPFDRFFDTMFETNFPEIVDTVGVKPFQGTAYPKVNVYEYDDKVSVVAEIPGISKNDINIDVEDDVLLLAQVSLLVTVMPGSPCPILMGSYFDDNR